MTTFQLATLPLLAMMIVATAVQMARHRLTSRTGAAWLLLWLAAAISIAFPEILVEAARLLGIGRGADLVLYLSILFSFAAFFITYIRFRRVDEQLTKIVRHLAIREGHGPRLEDESAATPAAQIPRLRSE
jgi:hypothetical protein